MKYKLLLLLIFFIGCKQNKPTNKTIDVNPDYSSYCDSLLPENWHLVQFNDSAYGAYEDLGYIKMWLVSKGSDYHNINTNEDWATHFKDTCELKANISDTKDYKVIR